jgi:hypothetical protein
MLAWVKAMNIYVKVSETYFISAGIVPEELN